MVARPVRESCFGGSRPCANVAISRSASGAVWRHASGKSLSSEKWAPQPAEVVAAPQVVPESGKPRILSPRPGGRNPGVGSGWERANRSVPVSAGRTRVRYQPARAPRAISRPGLRVRSAGKAPGCAISRPRLRGRSADQASAGDQPTGPPCAISRPGLRGRSADRAPVRDQPAGPPRAISRPTSPTPRTKRPPRITAGVRESASMTQAKRPMRGIATG
jgi:hypothetical protein